MPIIQSTLMFLIIYFYYISLIDLYVFSNKMATNTNPGSINILFDFQSPRSKNIGSPKG